MIKIKNTFTLILLIVNICHAQNDIFDIKNETDFIIIDNSKLNILSSLFDYIPIDATNDTLLFEKKDLKYSFGFSTGILGGPMQSDEKIVYISEVGKSKDMVINTDNLNVTIPFYYFKNLNFKDGKYTLYTYNTCKVKGNDIDVSERTKNILFKNIKVNNKYKDLHFKDIEFTVIDFKDTENVKLLIR